jgi:hypothetical protein
MYSLVLKLRLFMLSNELVLYKKNSVNFENLLQLHYLSILHMALKDTFKKKNILCSRKKIEATEIAQF